MNTTTNIVVPAYFPKSKIKPEGPSVCIMQVTPRIADFWLKTYNHSNRPLSQSNVAFLVKQIEQGEWVEMNGDSISFLPNGQLNDGQHRLKAIVDSKKTLSMLVIAGVDPLSFKTKDTGKKRTAGDVLAIEGYKEYATLASVSKFLISFNRGRYGGAIANSGGDFKAKISNSEVSAFVKANYGSLSGCVRLGRQYYSTGDKLVTITVFGALLFLFSKKDVNKAEKFLFQLANGSGVEHGTTMYYLRRKLLDAAMSDTKKLTPITTLAFIIKTWNCERTGKNKKRLQFSPSKGEKFPTII